jgi:hypothetical protein
MIKKDIHQKLSTKIRREEALSRLNNRLSSMIDQGTHWGHKSLHNSWKRLSYPEMSGAFLGSRKGVQIIDPVKTLQATSQGLYFAALVLKNKGRILVADTREEFSPVNYSFNLKSTDISVPFSGSGRRWINKIGLFGFWSMMVFLIILTIGFIYEWRKGALDWS